jgi:hypothetical protein
VQNVYYNCLYKLYVILKKCQLFIKNVSSIHHNGNFHHKRKSIGGIIVSMFAYEVRFVLGQNAELDFYSASSLKQQSAGRHVAPVGHIILIPSQPVFALSPKCCVH